MPPLLSPLAAAAAGTALALGILVGGCGGAGEPQERQLADGSRAPALPPPLRKLGGAAMTRVRVVEARRLERDRWASCLKRVLGAPLPPDTRVVERVGLAAITLTFRVGALLYACEDTPGPRERRSRWCGSAVGELRGGRLLDPRLDLACRDSRGQPLALAWVTAAPRARWLAVDGPTGLEVYRVVGGLPVRVVGGEVDTDRAAAVFDVSQYAADGRRLADVRLEASVAG